MRSILQLVMTSLFLFSASIGLCEDKNDSADQVRQEALATLRAIETQMGPIEDFDNEVEISPKTKILLLLTKKIAWDTTPGTSKEMKVDLEAQYQKIRQDFGKSLVQEVLNEMQANCSKPPACTKVEKDWVTAELERLK